MLAVLKEHESLKPDEPNFVLPQLGPIASGGHPEGFFTCKARTKIDSLLQIIGIETINEQNINAQKQIKLKHFKLTLSIYLKI